MATCHCSVITFQRNKFILICCNFQLSVVLLDMLLIMYRGVIPVMISLNTRIYIYIYIISYYKIEFIKQIILYYIKCI